MKVILETRRHQEGHEFICIANMLSCVPLVRSLICSYWLTEVLLETGTAVCPLRAPGFTVYLFIYLFLFYYYYFVCFITFFLFCLGFFYCEREFFLVFCFICHHYMPCTPCSQCLWIVYS
jgi:hypothetical protein